MFVVFMATNMMQSYPTPQNDIFRFFFSILTYLLIVILQKLHLLPNVKVEAS